MKKMTKDKKMKKLQKRQDEILDSFNSKERKLVFEAIDIEYKLTMAKEGHDCELE